MESVINILMTTENVGSRYSAVELHPLAFNTTGEAIFELKSEGFREFHRHKYVWEEENVRKWQN